MRAILMPVLATALLGCGQPPAKQRPADEDWCKRFYATLNLSDYVDPRTGRLSRDPTTGVVYYPGTNRVAITREESECIRREAQKAIDAYEGK